jgi:hypothetical protein
VELIFIVLAILCLDFAAARWGYDSRELLRDASRDRFDHFDRFDGFDI